MRQIGKSLGIVAGTVDASNPSEP